MLQLLFVQVLQCRGRASCGAGQEPHIHTGELPFVYSAPEGHCPHGHHHHHAPLEKADAASASPLELQENPEQEHNADAVYLPTGMHADREASRLAQQLAFAGTLGLPACHEFAPFATPFARLILPAPTGHPPDPPLYLLNLVFLI